MKNSFLLVFILILFSTISNAYSQNSYSKIEDEMLSSFKRDTINYDFLLSISAIDSTITQRSFSNNKKRLDNAISLFPPKEEKAKKEIKRIKKIYNQIHSSFLKIYEPKSLFTDIFKTGNYNCVSATAIYTYVFDQLEIPYHIKDLPSHVYLVAYPNSYQIHLETTAPGSYGFYRPKPSEIEKIIDELVNRKLILNSDIKSKGYDKVYQDYFYGKEFISKNSLIGMQYFNQSLYNLEDDDYSKAYVNIQKANLFYKSVYSILLNEQIVLSYLSKLKIEDEKSLHNLFDALSVLKFRDEIDENTVESIIYKIVKNNDYELIEKAIKISSNIEDNDLSDFCQIELLEYISTINAKKHNYDEAIYFGTKLLDINPESTISKEVLTYCIVRKFTLMPFSHKTLMDFLTYDEKFLFLAGDKRIDTYKAMIYGNLTEREFKKRNPDKGLEYLTSFEYLMDNYHESIQINPTVVSNLYLHIGRYYYGGNNFSKALKYFNKGLLYDPENYEIKKMIKWTIEDQ